MSNATPTASEELAPRHVHSSRKITKKAVEELNPGKNPWDRLPNESARSYEYFIAYRDMPAQKRSVARVAELFGVKYESLCISTQRHAWTTRVNAWVEHKARISEDAQRRQIERVQDMEIRLGDAMMDKAVKKVELMTPGMLKSAAVPAWAKEGSRLQRLALGLPTGDASSNVQVNVQQNVVISEIMSKIREAERSRSDAP